MVSLCRSAALNSDTNSSVDRFTSSSGEEDSEETDVLPLLPYSGPPLDILLSAAEIHHIFGFLYHFARHHPSRKWSIRLSWASKSIYCMLIELVQRRHVRDTTFSRRPLISRFDDHPDGEGEGGAASSATPTGASPSGHTGSAS